MMNLVGLCFIFTSILTAAVLSPTPNNQNPEVIHVPKQDHSDQNQNTEVIHVAKPGLSVILVQYEKEGTKISISTPQQPQQKTLLDEQTEAVEEEGPRNTQYHHTKEVICDAFGKCKHKIAGVFSKAKEKAVEVEEEVKEAVETVGEAVSKKAHGTKECAQEACGKAFKTAVDTGKTLGGDVRRNVSEDRDIVRRYVAEKAKGGLEAVETATGMVKDVVGDMVKKEVHAATQVRDKAKIATEKVKNVAGSRAKGGLESVESAAEAVKDKARGGLETVKDATDAVKDKAKGGLETVKDAKDTVRDKAKEGLESVETGVDKAKHSVQDKAKGGLEKGEKVKEKAKEGLETVETEADKVKHLVQDKFKQTCGNGFICRIRGMSDDVKTYVANAVSSSVGSLLGVIHLLGFAMAYGMSVWITFVSSYVLAGALPRQQFGMVQSKIYPLYFRAMAYSIGVALFGHVLSERRNMSENEAEIFQGYNLISSLLMVFANLLYLEPRATKVMYERMKVEKEEGRGRGEKVDNGDCAGDTGSRRREIGGLNVRLKKLNSMSSTLNILTLTSLTWHLVYLGQCLNMTACP